MAGKRAVGRTPREKPPHLHEPVLPQEVHTGSARLNRTARSAPFLAPGERHRFYCHACEHEADVLGREHKCSVGSFSPRCPARFMTGNEGPKACLNLIAKGVECEPYQLLDPRTVLACLEPWLSTSGGEGLRKQPPAPPSLGSVCGWHSALLSSGDPLTYLTKRRGLTVETLHAHGVGWDRTRRVLTFPAWRDGRPVYLYRRKPADGARMIAMGGPRLPYPVMPPGNEVWLVGGELDALSCLQMGLPAVSVCGCHLPDHAVGHFLGKKVYLALDVGEEPQAKSIAERLRSIGITVRTVRLARLGLRRGGDLNDAMLAGHAAEDIRALLRRGRAAA